MFLPYSYYSPAAAHKQANVNVKDMISYLNPSDNQLSNYGIYGGAGALGGAGIGALINLLRGESVLKGALIGGGVGGGLGLGAKAFGDYGMSDKIKELADSRSNLQSIRDAHPNTTGDAYLARKARKDNETIGDNVQRNLSELFDYVGGGAGKEQLAKDNIQGIEDSSALDAIRARLGLI